MASGRRNIALLMLACIGGAFAALTGSATASAAATTPNVKILAAYVGFQSTTGSTRDNPVRIDPKLRSVLTMRLRNDGSTPVHVRYLRLTGAALGIHFVNYQGSTNVDLAPGEVRNVSTPADFFDVDGVATGYVNAEMQAVDEQRNTLATQSFVADVHGKFASSEGLFFLEVVAIAVISLIDIGFSVARRRLPRNRFICGILFAVAAASTVIAIVIGAAMARVALFQPTAWVPALFLATAGAFFLGYISPGRLTRTAPEAADDKVIDLVAAGAVARATGEQERRTTGESVSHSSGDHTGVAAQQQSGEFTAATHQESGPHEPVA